MMRHDEIVVRGGEEKAKCHEEERKPDIASNGATSSSLSSRICVLSSVFFELSSRLIFLFRCAHNQNTFIFSPVQRTEKSREVSWASFSAAVFWNFSLQPHFHSLSSSYCSPLHMHMICFISSTGEDEREWRVEHSLCKGKKAAHKWENCSGIYHKQTFHRLYQHRCYFHTQKSGAHNCDFIKLFESENECDATVRRRRRKKGREKWTCENLWTARRRL